MLESWDCIKFDVWRRGQQACGMTQKARKPSEGHGAMKMDRFSTEKMDEGMKKGL